MSARIDVQLSVLQTGIHMIAPHPFPFPLGQIMATPAALEALRQSQQSAIEFVLRHASGDWGDLSQSDQRQNEWAVVHGARILSVYHTRQGCCLWVITEADRSATTIVLPDDY